MIIKCNINHHINTTANTDTNSSDSNQLSTGTRTRITNGITNGCKSLMKELPSKIKIQFNTTITHEALIVPARLTAQLHKSLSTILMNRPKLKDIYPLIEPDDVDVDVVHGIHPNKERKIVFKRDIRIIIDADADADATNGHDMIMSHELITSLLEKKKNVIANKDNKDNKEYDYGLYKNIRPSKHHVLINYGHYTVEQLLSKILPSTLCKGEIPSRLSL